MSDMQYAMIYATQHRRVRELSETNREQGAMMGGYMHGYSIGRYVRSFRTDRVMSICDVRSPLGGPLCTCFWYEGGERKTEEFPASDLTLLATDDGGYPIEGPSRTDEPILGTCACSAEKRMKILEATITHSPAMEAAVRANAEIVFEGGVYTIPFDAIFAIEMERPASLTGMRYTARFRAYDLGCISAPISREDAERWCEWSGGRREPIDAMPHEATHD